VVGLVVAIVSALVSTPLNVMFWGGQTGNVWGDALYAYCIAHNIPVWLSSFFDEIVVDIPDKVATVVIAFVIFVSLPKRLIQMYEGEETLERLD
jgi:energy-coupling factor transport system substrate-specific component